MTKREVKAVSLVRSDFVSSGMFNAVLEILGIDYTENREPGCDDELVLYVSKSEYNEYDD